jgi:hypothetical protein
VEVAPVIGAMMELSTERVSGMAAGSIPVSKIWDYIDRFDLPDWWEPVLLQSDAKLLASMNKESDKNARSQANKHRPKS